MATDYQPTQPEPLTDAEREQVTLPPDKWTDSYAGKVVVADFNKAAQYRNQNHDWRWRTADELYLAWVDQKYWEGTRVPRSSLGIFVAMEQIESLLPKVLSSIFAEYPWFDIVARPGTTPEEARASADLILQQAEDSNLREQTRRIIKSAFVYGNGIGELDWKYEEVDRVKYIAKYIPKRKKVTHPLYGDMNVPTGEFKRKVTEEVTTDVINQPELKYVSLKDFYIDPNCPSPIVQDARFAIKRVYMSIDELKETAEEFPEFNLPDDATLVAMANNKPTSFGDQTKLGVEVVRGGSWQPQIDTSVDPAARRMEVLIYTTKERLVWMLNRDATKGVVLNIANPFGFINFFNVHYVDVLDRFYAVAVTDVVEGEQRLITSVINGRVDELALSLHPTRIKRQGLSVPAYQFRRRPGQIIEAQDPKNDIVTEQVQNITQQAVFEVEAAERRVQKYTGVTDLAMTGMPGGGMGNSASRTATGVGAQVQAAFSRIQYLVENIEGQFLEPLLSAWQTMNMKFIDPNELITILGQQEGKAIVIDPIHVKNANVKFTLRASARMQSKAAIQQVLPLVMQTLLNPEFMQVLTQYKKKVNLLEVFNMLMDGTGYRQKYSFIEDMTQDEIAALNQPSPQQLMDAKMQQDRLEANAENTDLKQSGDMMKTVVKGVVDHLTKTQQNAQQHQHQQVQTDQQQSGDILKEFVKNGLETQRARNLTSGQSVNANTRSKPQ